MIWVQVIMVNRPNLPKGGMVIHLQGGFIVEMQIVASENVHVNHVADLKGKSAKQART